MTTIDSLPRRRVSSECGSTLIACLIIIGIVAFIAGTVLSRAIPAYRSTYHTNSWQEARLAADAGVDMAVVDIQESIKGAGTNLYPWPTWKLVEGGGNVPARSNQARYKIFDAAQIDLLKHGGDGSTHPKMARVVIDVITRDDNESKNPWYRIRSTGTAEIANTQLGLDKRDVFLRRISLQRNYVSRTVEVLARPVYLWEYALKAQDLITLGGGTLWKIDSYDSRYKVKVRTDPTNRASVGGNESALLLSPPGKYNGYYSGQEELVLIDGVLKLDPKYAGQFGNIASSKANSATAPWGPLIDAEGAQVLGEVQTNGGDNPATPNVFENVEEYGRIDTSKISSEFDETLIRAHNPILAADPSTREFTDRVPWIGYDNWPNSSSAKLKNPSSYTTLFTGAGSAGRAPEDPIRIYLTAPGNGAGSIPLPPVPDTFPRFIEIVINGNYRPDSPGQVVPKNVHVKMFINGDVNFGNKDMNFDFNEPSLQSRVPGNLLMFGVKPPSTSQPPRVEASGNGIISGAFYGPQYAGNLDGNTEILGGFVLKTYNIAGGGGGNTGDPLKVRTGNITTLGAGFHYDEALGVIGPIQEYRVVSYFEDSRKDVAVE